MKAFHETHAIWMGVYAALKLPTPEALTHPHTTKDTGVLEVSADGKLDGPSPL